MEKKQAPRGCLYLALAGILATVLALIVLAGELGARLFFPELAPTREERAKFWSHDPLLGWAHVPNTSGQFNHRDFSVSVSHNPDGLRNRELGEKAPGTKRLLVLGDSFTWGFGVEEDQRYSSLLDAVHPDWEVINAGVSGYSTDQQYLYLRERGIKYQPDAVLVLLFRDDVYANTQDEMFLYNKPRFRLDGNSLLEPDLPVPVSPVSQRVERWLLQRTYLGKTAYQAMAALGSMLQPAKTTEGDPVWSAINLPTGAVELTNRLLLEMNQFCGEHGARLFVAAVALSPEVASAMQRASREDGFAFFQLDEVLARATEPVRFPHDAHWNPHGHDVVAREIDKRLTELGLWQESTDPGL